MTSAYVVVLGIAISVTGKKQSTTFSFPFQFHLHYNLVIWGYSQTSFTRQGLKMFSFCQRSYHRKFQRRGGRWSKKDKIFSM